MFSVYCPESSGIPSNRLICPADASGSGSGSGSGKTGLGSGRGVVRLVRCSAGITSEAGSLIFRFFPSYSRVMAITSSQMNGVHAAAIRIHQDGA